MPLQPDQQQDLWNWLTSAVPQPECRFCATPLQQGNIGGIIEVPAASNPDQMIRMLSLTCGNCAARSAISIVVNGTELEFPTTVLPQQKSPANQPSPESMASSK